MVMCSFNSCNFTVTPECLAELICQGHC